MAKMLVKLFVFATLWQLNSLAVGQQMDVETPRYGGSLSPDYCMYRAIAIPTPIFPRHSKFVEEGCTVTMSFQIKPDGTVWFPSSDGRAESENLEAISSTEPEVCGTRYAKSLMKSLLKAQFTEDSVGASCRYRYVFKLEQ